MKLSPCRFVAFALSAVAMGTPAGAADPLPSWNEGPSKKAILKFVADVTAQGAASFVPPAERIATFDNDGTLWSEQPLYFQVAFALERVKALAPQHPEWKTQEPFKTLLTGDVKGALAQGEKAILEHHGRDPHRDDHRGVHEDGGRVGDHRQAPALRPPLHRDGLPADARAAGLPARERLQDLHRLRRRRRVHAPLGGEGLRHPSRAGRGQQRGHRSSRCGRPGRSS